MLISLVATPADDAPLPSVTTPGPNKVLKLRANNSFPAAAGFFALRATLQP